MLTPIANRFLIRHGEVGFDVWEGGRPIAIGLVDRDAARRVIDAVHEQERMVAFVAETITRLRDSLREDYNLPEDEIVRVIRQQLP